MQCRYLVSKAFFRLSSLLHSAFSFSSTQLDSVFKLEGYRHRFSSNKKRDLRPACLNLESLLQATEEKTCKTTVFDRIRFSVSGAF